MKKKLITSVALSTLLSASAIFAGGPEIIIQPDYFSGFYVGGTGAFHHVSLDSTSNVLVPSDITLGPILPLFASQVIIPAGTFSSDNGSGSAFTGYGGVQGGFGKVFSHQWYAGIQGFGEWGSASNTATTQSATPAVVSTIGLPLGILNITTVTTQSSSNSTTVKIGNDYGVAAKLGYLITPTTMFYGKIGAVWADITTSNNTVQGASRDRTIILNTPIVPVNLLTLNAHTDATLTGSSSNEDTKTAILLGIGAEQFVYGDMISINVEYDYANYGSVNTSTNMTAAGNSNITISNAVVPPIVIPIFSGSGIPTNVVSSASGNAKVSTLLAGLNFYFGRNWF